MSALAGHHRPPTLEVFLPLPVPADRVPPVTQLRSTLLASSLHALRERNLLEKYRALLPAKHHDVVLNSVAGVWLPVDVGIAHYQAMDALRLSPSDVFDIGASVAQKVQGTVLATLARLATNSGVTPWVAFAQLQRLWARLFVGGGVAVYKVAAKEARVDVLNVAFASIPYFRGAFRGLASVGIGLFCTKVYVTELPKLGTESSVVLRFAWA